MTTPVPLDDVEPPDEETAPPDNGPGRGWPCPEADLEFRSPEDFFTDCLSALFARDLSTGSQRWCLDWALHPEAVYNVDALWRAYERLKLDRGTGLAVWWTHYAYPQMEKLMAAEGTFKGCRMEATPKHNPTGTTLLNDPLSDDD